MMGAAQSRTSTATSGNGTASKLAKPYKDHYAEDRAHQRDMEKDYYLVEDEECESTVQPIDEKPSPSVMRSMADGSWLVGSS